VAALLLGVIFVIGGVGAGGYVAERPEMIQSIQDRLTGGDDAPRRIDKTGGDAEDRADWKAIALSVHRQKDALQRSCAVPDGERIQVELRVEADGAVRSATASSGGSKGACVADRLRDAQLDRVRGGTVEVALNLAW
jgi:hypothetical protein